MTDLSAVSRIQPSRTELSAIFGRQPLRSVAVLGNYLPRRCGIATFTTDFCNAVSEQLPDAECWVMAMNDQPGGYPYPSTVRYQIDQNNIQEYDAAARYLNHSGADVLCIQHEFGIFGGEYGEYLLRLLENVNIPVLVTLHTVLKQPAEKQRLILQRIAQLSSRLIVMGAQAVDILTGEYSVPEHKIERIPHGIPDLAFVRSDIYKARMGMAGCSVILTFGLLSPGKGIEWMIDAMPDIVHDHPEAQYVILGQTHPGIVATHGESYRNELQTRAESLNVQHNVRFVDEFISQAELLEYIRIADVFITPYLNEAQITSGVLSYALGLGKAIVSTPYWHAREALAENRGILVPFKDKVALADRISFLLENHEARQQLQMNAYQYGRDMVWSEVAQRYLRTMEAVLQGDKLLSRTA